MSDIFKYRDKTKYKYNIDPVKHYIEQTGLLVSKIDDVDHTTGKKRVVDLLNKLKKNNAIKNPKVRFKERDLNGNVETKTTTLIGYLNYVKVNKDIMVPSFTVYFNKKKKLSLHAEFINTNVERRSKHKKQAFIEKMNKNMEAFNYHNTLQKSMKIFNNSLSGAYASKSTILYNPSAHYTLTSITRCVSGIGNAISEMMIAGNRHYRNPNVAISHLTATLTTVDLDEIKKMVEKYRLRVPTTDEIMENIILKNTRRYWKSKEHEHVIYKFISKLNLVEKAAISFVNDFYTLRESNPKLVKEIFDRILQAPDVKLEDPKKYLKENVDGWVLNLVFHLLVEEMKGVKPIIDDLEDSLAYQVAKVAYNANKVFEEYEDLIKAFFVTDIFPPNIAYIKEMLREVIVLSDTDSTCATYQDWVKWYFGDYQFSPTAVGVSAIIMTFTTQVIDHYIKVLGGNMNIDKDSVKYLEMKNEFFWDVFANTDVSKHYFANVRIQEGNVYDTPDLEKKGVHLMATNAHPEIRKYSEKLMNYILHTIGANKRVDLEKVLLEIAEKEFFILDKLLSGSPDVLKLEKIKQANAYKAEIDKSPYLHYLLWQDVFSDRYGDAPDPTYMAVKVPTIINSKKDMNEWLDSMEDQEFANKLREFMKKHGKTEIKTFKLPLINVYSKGIPEELSKIIDYDRVIKDNVGVLYMVLATTGYYLKDGHKVMDILPKEALDEIKNKQEVKNGE